MPAASDDAAPFCLLLAGGAGSRLHELTHADCKPALPFAGLGRIVDFALANAHRAGLRQMLVATQYCPGTLERHLRGGWSAAFAGGLALRNGHQVCGTAKGYRGTADAVTANIAEIDRANPREVLILSADQIYAMDYRALVARHRETGAAVTIAVDEVPRRSATGFGVMRVDDAGLVRDFVEKPADPPAVPGQPGIALCSMGIYVFDWAWLRPRLVADGAQRGSGHDFAQDILPLAVAEGRAAVFRNDGSHGPAYWRDVGTLDAYRLAQLDFLDGPPPCDTPPETLRQRLPAAAGAVLDRSVALPGAQLAARARLTRTIVAPGAFIPPGLVVGEDADEDRRWFRVAAGGTVLVTQAMLARRAAERPRQHALCALPDLRPGVI